MVLPVLAALLSCLPLLMPSSLLATAWIVALGRQGVITSALQAALGGSGWTVFSLSGAAGALALRYFGVAVLILTHHRPQQAGSWPVERAFCIPWPARAFHLYLGREIRPAAAAWLVVMLLCMNDHVLPDMLLQSTYGTQILIMYSALMDAAAAAAMAAPVGLVGVLLVAAALQIARATWIADDNPVTDRPAPAPAWSKALAATGAVGILALAMAAPAGVLIYRTPSWSALGEALYLARDQAWQTLRLSAAAGIATALLAAALTARWLSCQRSGRFSAAPLVMLNLVVPPSLIGMGAIELANHWPLSVLRDTSWPLVLAYVARFLPAAMLLLYIAWRNEPALPRQAARVHGASPWQIAARIQWPARRLSLAVAALLCMLLAATELDVSLLLSPPGGGTLGVRLATLIHTASDPVVSALALDILLLVAPAMALLIVLAMRAARRGRAT